jgi:membrane-bound lytic murein transglycosylase B
MRVESNLGQYLGNLTVFNVFYTRLLTSPEENWQWDAANLVALGKYCYIAKVDCYSIKGSNAGAFGLAQFLPYSAMEWGVDGNSDGVVNLFDEEDSIPSAANFLAHHGWSEDLQDQKAALRSYYGGGKQYPKAVLAYANALRDTLAESANQVKTEESSPTLRFMTAAVSKIYCLFSSIPFCEK